MKPENDTHCSCVKSPGHSDRVSGERRQRSYGTISKFKKMLPGTRISAQMMQWILETEATGLEGGLDRRWGGAETDGWFLGGFPQYPNVH